MKGRTHALVGASVGYLAWPSIWGMAIGAVAGLLPDIDEEHSMLGRRLGLISLPINRVIGHRTATHSIMGLIVVGTIVAALFGWELAWVVLAGYAMHLVCDMLVGRVQLLWPLGIWVGIPTNDLATKILDGSMRVVAAGFCALLFIGMAIHAGQQVGTITQNFAQSTIKKLMDSRPAVNFPTIPQIQPKIPSIGQ